jgi:hypothetical protein
MMKGAGTVLILLAALVRPGYAAESPAIPSSAALAESMRQARFSDGFEARMNISTVQPDGRRSPLFKVAVIGQFGTERARLLIRGISPDNVRNRFFAAERRAGGGIRPIAYGEPISGGIAETDPFTKLFDSDLVIWDMFGPWWNWPKQSLGGTEQMAGHDCTIVRSESDAATSPIREVISCVDRNARLSLRTQLFDGRHTLIRTISVEQMMRKESGVMAAKKMLITGADNSITEIEVYSGDEHYSITADTFSSLDYRPAVNQ